MKKEFVSLTMVAMENEKKIFFTHNSNVCYGQKKFHRKRESYRFILTLKKLGLLDQCDLK